MSEHTVGTYGKHLSRVATHTQWSLHEWIVYRAENGSNWLCERDTGRGIPQVYQELREGHVYHPEDRFVQEEEEEESNYHEC